MENIFYTLLGALITFFGYNYFQRKGAKKVEKKVKDSNNKISNLPVANLIALAKSILARRDSSNR